MLVLVEAFLYLVAAILSPITIVAGFCADASRLLRHKREQRQHIEGKLRSVEPLK